jgi:hypothetical protein
MDSVDPTRFAHDNLLTSLLRGDSCCSASMVAPDHLLLLLWMTPWIAQQFASVVDADLVVDESHRDPVARRPVLA